MAELSFGQSSQVDSLKTILVNLDEDTSKVNTLNEIADAVYRIDPDEAIRFSINAKNLAEQINFPRGEALAYKNLGLGYYMKGEYTAALRNWEPSLKLFEELGDDKLVANLQSNMGAILLTTGKFVEAKELFLSALKMAEEMSDSLRISTLLLNIGLIYSETPGTYDEALSYYQRAIEMGEALGDLDIMGIGTINMGEIYVEKEEYDSALYYFDKSLNLLTSPIDIASVLNFIGSIYSENREYLKALNFYQDALELARKENAQRETVGILLGLASTYENLDNQTRAIEYYKEAESIAEKIGLEEELSGAYEGLATSYAEIEDYHNAYKYLSLQNIVDYTLYEIDSDNRTKDLMFNYEKEKKQYEIAILNKQAEIEQMMNRRQKAIIITAPSVIVFLLFTLLLILRFRYIRKVNVKINDQKDEIESQRDEIEAQRDEVEAQRYQLETQRDLVVVQKDEIIDSISYAKRIQTAMLPPEAYITELLNENFILHMPRDIVSGDFYWIKQVKQYIILLAADCTGHGVPGALMSMLGISYLNEIVERREITQANQILNELRKQIKFSLRQHGQPDEAKDGIDMALCVLDLKNMKMQYSGANSPLYFIRDVDDVPELKEIKADRMPIGYYQGKDKTFTNHDIQLEIGDTFYMFSDGFIDQKGGEDNKKFMSKNFKNLLLEIHDQPMYDQKAILDKTLSDWMGNNSQMDDILVMGVRV